MGGYCGELPSPCPLSRGGRGQAGSDSGRARRGGLEGKKRPLGERVMGYFLLRGSRAVTLRPF